MTAQAADLVVTGSYLLTLDDQDTIIEDGGIAVAGDHILEIGAGRELLEKYSGAAAIREEHGLIMPGLINTHTHAAMACFRGLADDLPLMQWLQDYIFPVETHLTGEIVYHSTLL
ncbi:MAG TPA: S-adenosylhomocysteine deaminase, partial [Desulfobacteraceae bacterium]|nr:S-adenosylhomocysteine deaminase [Desulfobacteraceae bacterium]